MSSASFYQTIDKAQLVKEFVGKSLKDVPSPSVVIDVAKAKPNCDRMLEASEKLGFGWRAHIKTHKTVELTKLQVGDKGPVNIIVSTILEAENILSTLLEYQQAGRDVSLLFSFPVSPSTIPRLSALSSALGPKNLALLIDHPSQLETVKAISAKSSTPPSFFLKIDMGYHRAGVIPQTRACTTLITTALELEKTGAAHMLGIYAHAGQSYAINSSTAAIDFLRQEFEALLVVANEIQTSSSSSRGLVLSVGATPTTTSVRNLLLKSASIQEDLDSPEGKAIHALRATIEAIDKLNCKIEIHAGVYCVLDLQQLATRALPDSALNWSDLALTVIAEVVSLYPGRGENGTTEALIGAGSLALGREPCKAYPGWGILTPWNRDDKRVHEGSIEEHRGWQVGKVSQEHGILQWKGEVGKEEKLEIGQKVRIWGNHACVVGAGFGWYLVVDGGDEIVDVWPRWNGW